MVSRYTGACMGLLAFAITSFAGLASGTPATDILSRSIWVLALFCVIGLAVGAMAQSVVDEHFRRQQLELDAQEASLAAAAEKARAEAYDDTVAETAMPVAGQEESE